MRAAVQAPYLLVSCFVCPSTGLVEVEVDYSRQRMTVDAEYRTQVGLCSVLSMSAFTAEGLQRVNIPGIILDQRA